MLVWMISIFKTTFDRFSDMRIGQKQNSLKSSTVGHPIKNYQRLVIIFTWNFQNVIFSFIGKSWAWQLSYCKSFVILSVMAHSLTLENSEMFKMLEIAVNPENRTVNGLQFLHPCTCFRSWWLIFAVMRQNFVCTVLYTVWSASTKVDSTQ